MNEQPDLIKAIRSGRLKAVKAALDAGAQLVSDDEPDFVLGIASFLGHVEIVRELVSRGVPVNSPDNSIPTSPLSMAVRGGKKEVVRALVELGAKVPDGMVTGLSEHELMLAGWIAFRDGLAEDGQQEYAGEAPVFEEIELSGHPETDTKVLEGDLRRLADENR
jgi:uncharacterized protein